MRNPMFRPSRRSLLPVAGLIVAAACRSESAPSCVVQSVSVAPNPVTLTVAQTATLTATVNATNCNPAPSVSWTSGSAAVGILASGLSVQITGVSVTASPVAVTASAGGQSGASQVTVTPPPSISFSAATLSFSAAQSGANPASQFITITNGGGGTLSGLSTGTITYGAGATGWLQAPTLNTTTAPATLTVQPVTGALAQGTYTATIPVLSGVASNSPQNLTVSFTVTSSQTVTAFVGNNQTGLVGFALNVRPGVRLTAPGNTPVPNVSVTFAVASGGGGVTTATVNTNASGVAQVGSWILGSAPGANTLTATVAGGGIVGNPVTFTATGAAAAFNVAIQNVGPAFSAAVQTAFNSAVAKWQQIIYQDIPDVVGFNVGSGLCGANSPAIGPVTVDDVLILARIDSIDGPLGTLGQAGPCFVRTTGRLTILGQMTFDSADVAALAAGGLLNKVILHEMGHVLGFGTLWTQTQFNCLQNASSPPGTILDTYFSCAKGVAMFDSIGGTSYTGGNKVPVENCGPASPATCGAGNVNGHWREPTFAEELMTGFLSSGTNPLSRLSAAAMEDLGYGVNYAGSDSYVHTFTLAAEAAAAAARASVLDLGDHIYRGPIYVVDRSGRVVEVIPPR
jgi:hypothetical protein